MQNQIKIILSSKGLYDKLKAVGKVVSNKSTIVVFDNFHFEVKDELLEVTGSDMAGRITTVVETDKIEGSGKFLIEHKLLLDALKELPDQPITIIVYPESYHISIKHEQGTFKMMGQNPDDYTLMKNNDDDSPEVLQVQSHVFVDGVRTALPYVSNDDLRPVMDSVFVKLEKSNLSFVASNASILAECIYEGIFGNDLNFMLDPKIAKIISDLADGEDSIELEIGSRTVAASFGGYEIIYRLVEGNYPNYKGIFPQDNDITVQISTKEFLSSLRRATIFTNKNSSLITINSGNNKLVITGKDDDFSNSAQETIPCSTTGNEIEIGFKAAFLRQCLETIHTDMVLFSLKDFMTAALFTPIEEDETKTSLTILLMPMAINV